MARHSKRVRLRGMSVTELVIVVNIVGILASVAAIRFSSSMENGQLEHAANAVLADLQAVREKAHADQQPYTMTFYLGSRRYDAAGVPSVLGAGDIAVALAAPPYNVSLISSTFPGNSVTFDGEGMPQANGEVVLCRGAKEVRIRITGGSIERVQ